MHFSCRSIPRGRGKRISHATERTTDRQMNSNKQSPNLDALKLIHLSVILHRISNYPMERYREHVSSASSEKEIAQNAESMNCAQPKHEKPMMNQMAVAEAAASTNAIPMTGCAIGNTSSSLIMSDSKERSEMREVAKKRASNESALHNKEEVDVRIVGECVPYVRVVEKRFKSRSEVKKTKQKNNKKRAKEREKRAEVRARKKRQMLYPAAASAIP